MTGLKRTNSAVVAEKWYDRTLYEAGDPARRSARRSARARLRRARTPLEVVQEPEALRLIEELPGEDRDRVAILAGILAFVEEKDDRKIARAIGRTSLDDENAIVSEARFRRLMQMSDSELLDPMRRLVHMAKRKANIRDVSASVLRWGDSVRKRWIFDYYGVRTRDP